MSIYEHRHSDPEWAAAIDAIEAELRDLWQQHRAWLTATQGQEAADSCSFPLFVYAIQRGVERALVDTERRGAAS